MVAEGAGPDARRLPLALLALAAALALSYLALPIASLGRVAALNYNEGWNAYHAEAVLSERPLYPPAGDLFPNNYPPLSFGLVAALGALLGDPIRAGRLLSLLALFSITATIAWLARRSTGSARLGAFGGLLFVALLGAGFGDYIGMNDPQFLAHALMLAGLALIVSRQTPLRLLCAALLMVLGGLVKHNLIALPLAVTFWLWARDRRAFGHWLAAAATCALLALAGLGLIFGADFFQGVLGPRSTSLLRAAQQSPAALAGLSVPLALALLAGPAAWRDREARLFVLYAALSLAIGIFFMTGEGVSYNVFFDLAIALSLLGPFLLARSGQLRSLAALALLLAPLLGAPVALLSFEARHAEIEKIERATHEDVDYLASRPGPALCETLALCFWAAKPASVDLFNSRQAFEAGSVSEEPLLERLARGEFAVVQLTSIYKDRADERVSSRLVQTLQQHYVVDRVSANGVFLRPRRGAAGR